MNLYLRLLWTWLRARGKPAIRFGECIELSLRVWPGDLDINGHMNNGRYMTITDLALVEYFTRSGLLGIALRRGWRPVLGGAMISFRRSLKPFRRYTLRFEVLGWDDRWSYMRFEFRGAGQTMAVGHAKGAVIGREGIVRSELALHALGMADASPPLPASLRAWIEAERRLVCAPVGGTS